MVNREKTTQRFALKAYSLWLIVAILLIASVVLTIDTATNGAEISRLEKVKTDLAQENISLTDTLVKSSSLNLADSKAKELNFFQPEKIVYISQKEAVAEAR